MSIAGLQFGSYAAEKVTHLGVRDILIDVLVEGTIGCRGRSRGCGVALRLKVKFAWTLSTWQLLGRRWWLHFALEIKVGFLRGGLLVLLPASG